MLCTSYKSHLDIEELDKVLFQRGNISATWLKRRGLAARGFTGGREGGKGGGGVIIYQLRRRGSPIDHVYVRVCA